MPRALALLRLIARVRIWSGAAPPIGGALALEDAINVASRATMLFNFIRAVRDQAAFCGVKGSGMSGSRAWPRAR